MSLETLNTTPAQFIRGLHFDYTTGLIALNRPGHSSLPVTASNCKDFATAMAQTRQACYKLADGADQELNVALKDDGEFHIVPRPTDPKAERETISFLHPHLIPSNSKKEPGKFTYTRYTGNTTWQVHQPWVHNNTFHDIFYVQALSVPNDIIQHHINFMASDNFGTSRVPSVSATQTLVIPDISLNALAWALGFEFYPEMAGELMLEAATQVKDLHPALQEQAKAYKLSHNGGNPLTHSDVPLCILGNEFFVSADATLTENQTQIFANMPFDSHTRSLLVLAYYSALSFTLALERSSDNHPDTLSLIAEFSEPESPNGQDFHTPMPTKVMDWFVELSTQVIRPND